MPRGTLFQLAIDILLRCYIGFSDIQRISDLRAGGEIAPVGNGAGKMAPMWIGPAIKLVWERLQKSW